MTSVSIAERLGGDEFLAQALSREHRHVPGVHHDVAGLLSWDDLNLIVACHRMEPPRMRLSADGDMLPLHRYSRPVTTRRNTVWHQVHPAELHARLAEGATLVLDAVDELHPPLGAFADELARFLRTRVQVNAYASFTGTEGFGTHWDDHDTLVVQLEGAKRWRVFGPTRAVPMFRDTEAPEEPPSEPLAELVLRPGDLLYVPRGWWHAVAADQGEHSLHVTCGLQTHTGVDLIGWVADRLRARTEVRADVPRLASASEQAAYAEMLAKLVVEELSAVDLVARYSAAMDGLDPGRLHASLPHVTSVPADPGLLIRLTTPRARLTANDGIVQLEAGGTCWDFAEPVAAILRPLVGGRTVSLAELAVLAGLPIEDVARVAGELVAAQVAAVGGSR
ncbi:cupin domain-containing protein [Yinghuangia sp. ASG 101]|uniref:cupin domain-containing protein n=1 Tax=Yinghuangia sp. ASG 101 TaxID=2896848 RepID=UPI001E3F8A66|nr:cupin domain-containing protein [Yinghuangia sp. ASG 101]UGQ14860.1 cupin domain-containing protein [Yinghuangia sp. ASG 101]